MGHKALCVYQLSGQHRCSEQPSTRRECSTSPTPLLSGGRPLRGTQTWSHQSHSATVRSTLFPFTWPTDSQRRAWEISLRAKEPPRIWSNQPGTEPRPSTLDPRPSQARRLERGPRWLAAAQGTDHRRASAEGPGRLHLELRLSSPPQAAVCTTASTPTLSHRCHRCSEAEPACHPHLPYSHQGCSQGGAIPRRREGGTDQEEGSGETLGCVFCV